MIRELRLAVCDMTPCRYRRKIPGFNRHYSLFTGHFGTVPDWNAAERVSDPPVDISIVGCGLSRKAKGPRRLSGSGPSPCVSPVLAEPAGKRLESVDHFLEADAGQCAGRAFGAEHGGQRPLLLGDQVDRLQLLHVPADEFRIVAQHLAKLFKLCADLAQHRCHFLEVRIGVARAGCRHEHGASERIDGARLVHAASRAASSALRAFRSSTMIMRSSCVTRPSRKPTTLSPEGAGGGCSASSVMATISLTEWTISPRTCPPDWVTMMAWRAVASVAGQPSRAARSTTGNTVPRRLTTPAT